MAATRKAAEWVPRRPTFSLEKWNTFVQSYNRPPFLRGGKSDGCHPNDLYFVPLRGELEYGFGIEKEHCQVNDYVPLSIAMDHLMEDPRYYYELEIMKNELRNSRLSE